MQKANLDVIVTYSSESEASSSRYLAGFWPFFDFAASLCRARGRRRSSPGTGVVRVRLAVLPDRHPHSPAARRVFCARVGPRGQGRELRLPPSRCLRRTPEARRHGGWNIFPHVVFEDLRRRRGRPSSSPPTTFCCGCSPSRRRTRSLHRRGVQDYRAGHEGGPGCGLAGGRGVGAGSAGGTRDARAGGRRVPVPVWVCSGPNTPQSLCRSTDRASSATSWSSSPSGQSTWATAETCAGRSRWAGCRTRHAS